MKSTFKKTLLASLVVPFALGAQSASAALITNWGYNVDSSFTAWTATDGDGAITPSGGTPGNPEKLSWGVGGVPQSSISISDAGAGSGLMTGLTPEGGNYVNGGVFTHVNNELPSEGLALDTFDLTSKVTLTPFAPSGGASPDPFETTFSSFFIETGNTSNTNCGFTSTSGCDDIFTVVNVSDGAELNAFGNYEISSSFGFEGYLYTVFLELQDLAQLEDEACTAAGADPGCVGLLTLEEGDNEFQTRFRITAAEIVPEPGTLALLGMGLAGLGLSRRRKAAKS